MDCPACQRQLPEGAAFCGYCGASLRTELTCAACGVANPIDMSFCMSCGGALRDGPPLPRMPSGAPLPPVPPAAGAPASLAHGRYRVRRVLGEGAKKRVYLARDERLDRDVALSLLKSEGLEEGGRERVRREAEAMGRLGDHPNIVTIHDVAEEGGHLYIVSQFMGGGDLEGKLAAAEERRLELPEALAVAKQVAAALEHAHGHGVIHRDVKPGNIWLADDGTAQLGDFGLAMSLDRSRLTQEGMIVGTAAYLPPEQALSGEVTARSDLYSLGATLYELVTGRPPFVGADGVAVIGQHLNATPVAPSWHNPEVPEALEAVILRLLAKDPTQRFESASALREALSEVERDPGRAARPQDTANPLDRLAQGIFVGREAELATLRRCVDRTLSGHSGVLLLVGEPGIGKTRTAEELTTYARMRGARVLWGRCYEGEGAPPYWPWVQINRAYVEQNEPSEILADMGPGAADVAEIVPAIREKLPGLAPPQKLEPEQARFRLFDSVATFTRNASARAPHVLVLDDLHWADKPTLLLLEFMAQELGPCRVLIVGTYRDVELGRQHPLADTLAALARGPATERVILRGLAEADVERFIREAAGVDPPPRLVEAVFRETEGNPFFIHEVVRLLVADGRLEDPDRAESWSVTIPQGVREVIGRRLMRLSEECNQLLTLASVVGREFDLRSLEEVSGLAADEVLKSVDEAAAARVVEEHPDSLGSFRFSHALVRETLYEELNTGRRVRLHRQVGEALERQHQGSLESYLPELARHFSEAAPGGDIAKAIDYAARAGARAAAALAFEDAAEQYERALQAMEHLAETNLALRCDLLVGLGDARCHAGEVPSGRASLLEAAELAREQGWGERLVSAALAFPQVNIPGLIDADARRLFRDAADVAKSTQNGVVLLGRLIQTYNITSDAEDAWGLLTELEERAGEVGTPDAEILALISRNFVAASPDALPERRRISERIAELAIHVEDPDARVDGYMGLLINSLLAGEVATTWRLLDEAEAVATEQRIPLMRYWTGLFRGMQAQFEGRFEDVPQLAEEAYQLGLRANPPMAVPWKMLQQYNVAMETGDVGEFEQPVRQMSQVLTAVPAWRGALAWLLAVKGQHEEVREILAELTANGCAAIPRDINWSAVFMCLSEACALVDEPRFAEPLYEELRPYGHLGSMIGAVTCSGSTSRWLGMLATVMRRFDAAEEHFREALAANERMQTPPYVAHTRYEWAKMLLRQDAAGDRARALELLNAALDTAGRLGMTNLIQRAVSLKLEAQGASTSDTTSSIYALVSTVGERRPDFSPHAAADGHVTLIFSDIEEFTRMTERLGDARAHAVVRRHNDIVRAETRAQGGHEVELRGDGFLLAFADATAGLRCAIGIQRALAAHNASGPVEPLRVRIGLHTGHVIQDADKFFGKTVIQAFRVADLAEGTQILISEDLKAAMGPATDFRIGEGREVTLKGISGTHRVYSVEWS